jgi:glycosyltransferase involved in cell wall biosynthesis
MFEEHNKNLGIWYGPISNFLIKRFYPLSDIFIAQCQAMKDNLVTCLKLDEIKVVVINNPINLKIEDYLKNISWIKDVKKNYILCVGRLTPQKTFHYIIEAFARISIDYPLLRLKILGQGSMEDKLKRLVEDLKITDKVDFEGYQQDIIPYYIHTRLTALTSLFEGFPNVLIESIALGTPVVAFDCPSGPSEIVQDDINGYLVKYQDLDHLVECLKKALDREWNPETVQLTVDKFASSKIIDEYERLLA